MSRNSTRRAFLAGSGSAALAVASAETAHAEAASHDAVGGSLTKLISTDGGFVVAPSHRGRWNSVSGRARITYWQDPMSGDRYANAVHPVEGA